MAVYSIRDLARLSGLKAHTIRAWETRYGIIQPQRSKTNIRYYQDEDLKFLLNITLLNRNGLRISKIAQLSRKEIAGRVAELAMGPSSRSVQLDALILSMVEMDEYKFDQIFSKSVLQIGFDRTMLEVIFPFLEKISLIWLTGTLKPAQESFMSCLIRRKITAQIDATKPVSKSGASFLLYLPDGERQELTLLFMQYLLRQRGFKTIYLGSDISIVDLVDACEVYRPDFFYTIISETFGRTSIKNYITTLANRFPDVRLLLSGYQPMAQEVPNSEHVLVLKSLPETIRFLDNSIKG